jgi:hypothetical protein
MFFGRFGKPSRFREPRGLCRRCLLRGRLAGKEEPEKIATFLELAAML